MQCHVLGVALLPVVGALLVADARRRGARPGPAAPSCWPGSPASRSSRPTLPPARRPRADDRLRRDAGRAGLPRAGGEPPDHGTARRAIVVIAPGRRVAAGRPHHRRTARGGAVRRAGRAPSSSGGGAAGPIASGRRSAGSGSGCCGRPVPDVRGRRAWPRGRPGLPNDHYHAFADPMVFVLIGLGAARRGASGGPRTLRRRPHRPHAAASAVPAVPAAVAAVVVVALVGWNVANLPPARRPTAASRRPPRPRPGSDGPRRPRGRAPVAARIQAAGDVRLPARPGRGGDRAGGRARKLVIVCDALFESGDRGAVRRSGGGCVCERVGPALERSSTSRRRPRRPTLDLESVEGRLDGGRAGPAEAALSVSSARRPVAETANAGAPDAGVRCPRSPDRGGRSGPCPR